MFQRAKNYRFIIAALGNPGDEYKYTRHNVGFMFADFAEKKLGIKIKKHKFNALYSEITLGGEKGLIVKPLTYMNASGEALRGFADAYGIPTERVLVIVDDINLPLYEIRIRKKGSPGGHNGLKSIERSLKSDNYPRIRVGVGQKAHEQQDLKDYVLSDFTKKQVEEFGAVFERVLAASELCVMGEFDAAMGKFNGRAG